MKYNKRSLIECACCGILRHENEVVHMGDRPTIYICKKCLESEGK